MKLVGAILTAIVISFLSSAASAVILMWCLSFMHRTYSVIPTPGFWFCYVFCIAVSVVVPYRNTSNSNS